MLIDPKSKNKNKNKAQTNYNNNGMIGRRLR